MQPIVVNPGSPFVHLWVGGCWYFLVRRVSFWVRAQWVGFI